VHAHQQNSEATRSIAADTVAEVAEQRRAQRAGDKGDTEGEERREHLRGAGALGKNTGPITSAAAVA
jgi:hypothetical protein